MSNTDELNTFTPLESRAFLENLQLTPDTWEAVRAHASHQLRALIHIAESDEPKNLLEVYKELYPNEPMHWIVPRTEEDVSAEHASAAAWGRIEQTN